MGARYPDVPRGAPAVASCGSCLAWGLTHSQGVCLACYNFARRSFGHAVGQCACGRRQPLKEGYCRLCWCQARVDRAMLATDARSAVIMAPYLRAVRHHQLFLANLDRRRAKARRIERRRGAKGRPLKPPPVPAARPVAAWIQPPLFDPPRIYAHTPVDLRRSPAPDNPYLTWALHLAHTKAEARGWSPFVRGNMQRILVTTLADYRLGEQVRASDLHPLVRRQNLNMRSALEILAEMGVLDEDRPEMFDLWIIGKLASLAPAIERDVYTWARALLDGAPRLRPRTPATVRNYLSAALPALTDWSTRYHHLREVTTDDITAALKSVLGRRRQTAHSALRCLFSWAKRNKLIFRNPTTGIRGPRIEDALWQPLHPEQITCAVAAATTPQARLYLALAAVHAARPGKIRTLLLDDVDLRGRRITIGEVTRPLDELTYRLLVEWLEHRSALWPNTANPHLLVSRQSALHHGPVGPTWIRNLRGTSTTLERLRIDRQLDEALASGADPLHLAAVFGISDTSAIRYATNASALLAEPEYTDNAASPRTQARATDPDPEAHLSSR